MTLIRRHIIEPYSDRSVLDENGDWCRYTEVEQAIAARDQRIAELEAELKTIMAFFPPSAFQQGCKHSQKYPIHDVKEDVDYHYCPECARVV